MPLAGDFSPEVIRSRLAFRDLPDVEHAEALHIRVGPVAAHRRVTFGELHRDVQGGAAGFASAGGRPGQLVALLLPHSYELVVAFFAALSAGLVPSIIAWPTVKMDAEKYHRNLRCVLEGLAADFLITDARMAQELGATLGAARVLSSIPRSHKDAAEPRVVPGDSSVALVQFSGGTTGAQKSVPISLSHLSAQLEAYASVLGLGASDRVVSWLPLYHDMGLVACLLLPFLARIPMSMFAPMEWVMDPRPFLRAIGADRATLAWLPNFAFTFMAKRVPADAEALDLSSLRHVINCSEPVRAESMDLFLERFSRYGLRADALSACYAMAEATFAVTQTTPAAPPKRISVSVHALGTGRVAREEGGARVLVSSGPPIPGVEVRVVDDGGRDVREDCLGEIWLRGAAIMTDYFRAAERGAMGEAFTDGWYRTGDLGFLAEGHLFVTGRKKDVIIVGGVNIYPEDVELAVSEIAGIHAGRAVAMGVFNDPTGTEGLAVVAEVDDPAVLQDSRALEREVRSSVVAMVGLAPAHVFLVPPKWIVKSTAGKISRSETRERVLARWEELTTSSSVKGAVR